MINLFERLAPMLDGAKTNPKDLIYTYYIEYMRYNIPSKIPYSLLFSISVSFPYMVKSL